MKTVVCGIGPHAMRNLLPAFARADGVELYGVCSRSSDAVSRARSEFGCNGWTDFREMLADESVQAVFLATPFALHASQGKAVLLAGKHLWCEKPFTATLADTVALTTLAEQRKLTVAEGLMYLYHPQFAQLVGILNSGRIGYIHTVLSRFGIPPLERPSFRTDPKLAGGALLDVGCYPVSAALALLGDRDPKLSFAAASRENDAAPDYAGRVVLEFERGATAVLEWAVGVAYRNEIDVWGTKGSVWTDRIFSKPPDCVPRFRVRDERGNEMEEEGMAADHFAEMLESFAELAGDTAKGGTERAAIIRRAGVMQQITDAISRNQG